MQPAVQSSAVHLSSASQHSYWAQTVDEQYGEREASAAYPDGQSSAEHSSSVTPQPTGAQTVDERYGNCETSAKQPPSEMLCCALIKCLAAFALSERRRRTRR